MSVIITTTLPCILVPSPMIWLNCKLLCDVEKHAQLSFVQGSRNKKHISKLLNIVDTKLLLKFCERNRTEILNGKYGEDDKKGSDM